MDKKDEGWLERSASKALEHLVTLPESVRSRTNQMAIDLAIDSAIEQIYAAEEAGDVD